MPRNTADADLRTVGEDPDDGIRDLRTVLDTHASDPGSAIHDTVVMPLAAGRHADRDARYDHGDDHRCGPTGPVTTTATTTAADQRAR